MRCNCIATINKKLAERNTRLAQPYVVLIESEEHLGLGRVLIETEKVADHKRGKPMPVASSFCPFCGEKQ